MTAEQWYDYLMERMDKEGVERRWSKAELYGWCSAGIQEGDNEEDVWAAFLEAQEGKP